MKGTIGLGCMVAIGLLVSVADSLDVYTLALIALALATSALGIAASGLVTGERR